MSAHTPGPWRIDYQRRPDEFEIRDAKSTGGKAPIAKVKGDKRSTIKQAAANALLIAAAPDLLDAVESCVLWYASRDPKIDQPYPIRNQPPEIQRALLAIAKATGQYKADRITWELKRTAVGDGFYGEALSLAMDMPGVTEEDRALLERFATGRNAGTDHIALQDLALRIECGSKSPRQREAAE